MSGSLPEYAQYMLLEDRGISNMMKDVPCNKTLVTWNNSTDIGIGWTTSMLYDILLAFYAMGYFTNL